MTAGGGEDTGGVRRVRRYDGGTARPTCCSMPAMVMRSSPATTCHTSSWTCWCSWSRARRRRRCPSTRTSCSRSGRTAAPSGEGAPCYISAGSTNGTAEGSPRPNRGRRGVSVDGGSGSDEGSGSERGRARNIQRVAPAAHGSPAPPVSLLAAALVARLFELGSSNSASTPPPRCRSARWRAGPTSCSCSPTTCRGTSCRTCRTCWRWSATARRSRTTS